MKKFKMLVVLMSSILLLIGCSNLKTKESQSQSETGELKTYSTDYFEFQSSQNLKILQTVNKEWLVFKETDDNIDLKNEDYYTTISTSIKIIEDKIELEIDNYIQNYIEKNIKSQGVTEFQIKKLKKELSYEIEVNYVGFQSYINLMFLNDRVFELWTNVKFPGNDSEIKKQKQKENILLRKEILKTLKIKDYKKRTEVKKRVKEIISKSEALEDAKELNEMILLNSALNFYWGKVNYREDYEKLLNEINKKEIWKKRELLVLLKEFIAKLEDGHTRLSMKYSLDGIFPLSIINRKNKIIISKNSNIESSSELLGAEIVSINDIPAEEILNEMRKIISLDHGVKKRLNYEISLKFPLLFYLLFGEFENYSIEYKLNGEKYFRSLKKGNPFDKKNYNFKMNYEMKDKDVVILKVPDFKMTGFNNLKSFKGKLEELRQMIKNENIKNLIVDIRNNNGGYTGVAEILYDFLVTDLKNHIKEENIYVLINSGSFSAGTYFPWMLKNDESNILLIGEETGTSLDSFGDSKVFKLHNSDFIVSMSSQYYKLSSFYFGKTDGVYGPATPDIEVKIDSIKEALGEDQIMDKVMELINEGEKS